MNTGNNRVPADAQVELDLLQQYGLRGKYVEKGNHPDEAKRIQVRGEKTLAPQKIVVSLTAAYKRGDDIPPILVTRDGWIIAGNTRNKASKKAGQASIRMIIVDASWDGAAPAVKNQILKVAGKTNNIHGQRMTAAENEALIVAVYTEGDSPRRLADETGVSESVVGSMISVLKARKRAQETGADISDETLVPRSVLRLLGKKIGKLNMEPWTNLLLLARDAALTVEEATDLTRRLEKLNTDGDKGELLTQERFIHEDRIRRVRAGGKSKVVPSKPGRVRQHAGFFLGEVADSPEDYAETDTRIWDGYLQDLYEVKRTITKLLTAQLKVMEKE